jgi:hypothetical protein
MVGWLAQWLGPEVRVVMPPLKRHCSLASRYYARCVWHSSCTWIHVPNHSLSGVYRNYKAHPVLQARFADAAALKPFKQSHPDCARMQQHRGAAAAAASCGYAAVRGAIPASSGEGGARVPGMRPAGSTGADSRCRPEGMLLHV